MVETAAVDRQPTGTERAHKPCLFCRRAGVQIDAPAPRHVGTGEIELDEAGFRQGFVGPRVPVVFPGIASGSAAVATWTPESLAERAGDTVVTPKGGATTLREYVARLTAGEPDLPIVSNEWLREMGGGLADDFEIPEPFRRNWMGLDLLRPFRHPEWDYWVEFFLGPPGGRFHNVHMDAYMTQAFSVQIYGVKRFYLWEPWPGQAVLPALTEDDARRANEELTMDHAPRMQVDLHPGDAVFIPAGWWHTTRILSTSITLGGNFINESDWCDFLTSLRLWSRINGWGPHRTAGLAAAHIASPYVARRYRTRMERPSTARWTARTVSAAAADEATDPADD